MHRVSIFCLVWAVLLLPSAAPAQGPPGSELLRACGAAQKQSDGINISDEESIGSNYCIGYISGFLDSLALCVFRTMANTHSGRSRTVIPAYAEHPVRAKPNTDSGMANTWNR